MSLGIGPEKPKILPCSRTPREKPARRRHTGTVQVPRRGSDCAGWPHGRAARRHLRAAAIKRRSKNEVDCRQHGVAGVESATADEPPGASRRGSGGIALRAPTPATPGSPRPQLSCWTIGKSPCHSFYWLREERRIRHFLRIRCNCDERHQAIAFARTRGPAHNPRRVT